MCVEDDVGETAVREPCGQTKARGAHKVSGVDVEEDARYTHSTTMTMRCTPVTSAERSKKASVQVLTSCLSLVNSVGMLHVDQSARVRGELRRAALN